MRPRKYISRIEVWKYEPAPDGYGGNSNSETKLGDSFCNIRTLNIDKQVEYGLDENRSAVVIALRKRNDIDYDASNIFFVYKGIRYTPARVSEKDLRGYEFEILAYGNGQGSS